MTFVCWCSFVFSAVFSILVVVSSLFSLLPSTAGHWPPSRFATNYGPVSFKSNDSQQPSPGRRFTYFGGSVLHCIVRYVIPTQEPFSPAVIGSSSVVICPLPLERVISTCFVGYTGYVANFRMLDSISQRNQNYSPLHSTERQLDYESHIAVP